jgi:16S rRNA (cytosine1402-N4)-methyltransferase
VIPSNEAPTPSPLPGDFVKPKRRPRYSGKNPRRFDEKYKERDPARYAEDVAKVLASGKTPAGSHRPIMVTEILEVLAPKPGDVAVDCTLGYGGHARALLARLAPGSAGDLPATAAVPDAAPLDTSTDGVKAAVAAIPGRLIALDVDPLEQPKTVARLRAAGFSEEVFTPVRRNFAGLPQVLTELGLGGADAILADLGVSSMQLDDPTRGFTFKDDGPLDLRLNPQRAPTAAQLLATIHRDKLAALLAENADEPQADILARELIAARDHAPITRTRQLAEALREMLQRQRLARDRDTENACVRRVFQALRIAVNDEFGVLDMFLRNLPTCLKPGGRVAVLTFHSGEDRRVKKAFQEGERSGVYSTVAPDVIRPTAEEVRSNSRSAPAKLRWAVRAG